MLSLLPLSIDKFYIEQKFVLKNINSGLVYFSEMYHTYYGDCGLDFVHDYCQKKNGALFYGQNDCRKRFKDFIYRKQLVIHKKIPCGFRAESFHEIGIAAAEDTLIS